MTDDFLDPGRVCPHLYYHPRPTRALEQFCKILLRGPQFSFPQDFAL